MRAGFGVAPHPAGSYPGGFPPERPDRSSPFRGTSMVRLSSPRRLVPPTALLCCLLLAGCGGKGKPTKANFDKVVTGMSETEVDALLGPSTEGVNLDPG